MQEPEEKQGSDLSSSSVETVGLFADESADPGVFTDLLESNKARPEVVRLLYDHPATPDEVRSRAADILHLPRHGAEDLAVLKRREAEKRAREIQEKVREDRLVKRIQKLSVSEKIKLALKGGTEARGILLKDSNKMVVLSVLENPRLTEPEVEQIARNRSIVEDALRVVARNREWMKSYTVQLALVTNPKTPVAISMKLVPGLKKRDIQQLEKNKNVPEAVRALARKFVKTLKQ
ncbi:MAG: hypothetical protein P8Y66_08170 [Nitrospirota bacterium]|jgi:hypothetical protein